MKFKELAKELDISETDLRKYALHFCYYEEQVPEAVESDLRKLRKAYFRTKEAVKYMGISRSAFYTLMNNYHIKPLKFGDKDSYYSVSELDRIPKVRKPGRPKGDSDGD